MRGKGKDDGNELLPVEGRDERKRSVGEGERGLEGFTVANGLHLSVVEGKARKGSV